MLSRWRAASNFLVMPSYGDMNHRNVNPCLAAASVELIVFGQAPVCGQPGKRSFDNPAPRQDNESFDVVVSFDDFEYPVAKGRNPSDELAGIPAIGPNQFETRKGTHQLH